MSINMQKLFARLSIRKKLIIAFTLLSFIPLIVIGLIGIYYNIHTLKKNAFDNLNYDVLSIRDRVKNFLTNIDLDIRYLSTTPVFNKFLEELNKNRDVANQEYYNLVQLRNPRPKGVVM